MLRRRLQRLKPWGVERITLVHVLSSRYPATPEESHRGYYERRLAEEAGTLAEDGCRVEQQVCIGEPGAEVTNCATEVGADLVLLGCRGHSRVYEFLLGSTALDAARLTPVPLWLEPVDGKRPETDTRLLMLATDGSGAVAGAERVATLLAPRFQRVLAVTATCASEGCDREIADAQQHLDGLAGAIDGLETRVLDGDPRRVLVETAKQEDADLVVIGKRGRNRIGELLLGSTAEAVSRGAHCPVLVVPGR